MVSVQIAALVAALSAGGETALLDFHAPWCAPCRSMEGAIAQLEHAGYPVRKVNVDHDRHLAKQFNVQNIPCFVLVVDGKEAGRLTGNVSRDELETMLVRAGVERASAGGATARAQSPDPPRGVLPAVVTGGSPLVRTHFEQPASHGPQSNPRHGAVAPQDLINASVRLTIGDPQGNSFGTGTLIDARHGEALVVTCGHIFRDSQGKGQISIDLCAPGGPQKMVGRLVSYDLESDVGLVSFRPGVPVRVARLAGQGQRISPGDRVITVGCNHGKAATAEESKITAVNKFRAGPNLSVAGLPVQGRSGGGLFTADGQVIGVCNAADPSENEGLFAALAAIQTELDEVGLAVIYEQAPAHPADKVAHLDRLAGPAAESSPGEDAVAQVMPANLGSLADVDRQTLAAVQERADGAEVICIVRPLSSPQAKTEVIMLDRASSAFLQQLAVDRRAQASRHLTSLKVRSQAPPRQVSGR
jgi:thiol-disulfide isomerase/thioredoxin